MTAGVFDFDAIGKRVKELGIEPVYGSVAPAREVLICPPDGQTCTIIPCEKATNCRIRLARQAQSRAGYDHVPADGSLRWSQGQR